jgi:hypothetical protein
VVVAVEARDRTSEPTVIDGAVDAAIGVAGVMLAEAAVLDGVA